jgi:hypothetical protein
MICTDEYDDDDLCSVGALEVVLAAEDVDFHWNICYLGVVETPAWLAFPS